MSDQTQGEREAMALGLAREDGRRQQVIDGRLDSHEQRLTAINGSIDRTGDALRQLGGKVDDLAERQRIRDAVDADRLKELKDANEKQITSRQFTIGVAAIVAPLLYTILRAGGHA